MIIKGEPNAEYHAADAVSASKLKDFARSPYYYYERHVKQTMRREPTPSMELGSAIHAASLEPQRYEEDFAVKPKFDRRTNAGKAAFEVWAAEHGHKTQLTPEQAVIVYEVANRARFAIGSDLYGDALVEATIRTDCEYGVLQARPDLWTETGRFVDLKTTSSIAGFRNQFWSMGYHLQDAFYRIVHDYERGEDPGPIQFLVVETTPPYEHGWVSVDPETATLSKHYCFRLLERLWECRQSDSYPYTFSPIFQAPTELAAPGWLRAQLEEAAAESVVGLQALAAFETGGEA